jgi:hypothetical protein
MESVLTGGNSNGGIQLQPGTRRHSSFGGGLVDGDHGSVVCNSCWHWNINFVILYVSFFSLQLLLFLT